MANSNRKAGVFRLRLGRQGVGLIDILLLYLPAKRWAIKPKSVPVSLNNLVASLVQRGDAPARTASPTLSFSHINVDPLYDLLHNDPRFKEMVKRMGLAT